MPNVLNEFAGDGVATSFNFSMTGGYLSRDYVFFYTRPNGDLLAYTPYPDDNVTWIGDFTVQTAAPIPVGTTFVIVRSTTLEPLVDFQNTSRITEKNLDTATWQGIHIAAENSDLVGRIQVVARGAKAESEAAMADAAAAAADAVAAANAAIAAQVAAQASQVAAVAAGVEATDAAASAAAATTVANDAAVLALSADATATSAAGVAAAATTAANTATATANTALTNSSTAVSTANSATTTANASSTAAGNAVATASAATTTANNALTVASEAKALIDSAVSGAVVAFNGRDGDVVPQSGDYTKAQVGLGNVDNTADVDKPVSTAQSNAIGIKADISYVTTQLGNKADSAATTNALALKADKTYVDSQSTADRARANHTGTQPYTTITGLGSSATRDVGTALDNVIGVGSFGLGDRGSLPTNVATTINDYITSFKVYNSSTVGAPDGASGTIINAGFPNGTYGTQVMLSLAGRMFFRAGDYAVAPLLEVYSTGNVTATGKSLLSASTPAAGRAALGVVSLGVDQGVNDLGAARSIGVTYTNTSGKPIWVTVLRYGAYGSAPLQIFVSGVIVDWSGVVMGTYPQYDCVQAIVPPGATYSVTSGTAIAAWRELR